jgi:protein-tyrosine phosphatase
LAPERFPRYLDKASDLVECVRSGALIQLSAASLIDQTNRDRVQFCKFLIRKRLCHLVASETGQHHDLPISLNDAYQTITRWFGRSRADTICCDNPASVFAGENLRAVSRRRRSLNPFSRSA